MKYLTKLHGSSDNKKLSTEEYRALVEDSPLLSSLRNILTEELEALEKTSKGDYDKAGWPFYQAHKNGEVEHIRKLLELLS